MLTYIFCTKKKYFVSFTEAMNSEQLRIKELLRFLALRFVNENVCISMNAIVNLHLIYP